LPAWHNTLLPNGQAADCSNTYLFSGALQGWRAPTLLRALNNTAARYVYRLPTVSETQALAYLVFTAQPQAGDTFSVGELTYTWVTALGLISGGPSGGTIGLPYQIVIGVDAAASATNALAAMTVDNGQNTNAGVLYGQNTVANADVLFYAPGSLPLAGLPAPSTGVVNIGGTNYNYVVIGSVDFGTAFNLIPVSESTGDAHTTWLRDLLSLADTTATYTGGSNPNFNNSITGAATWLEFLDQDTNVVRSQVVDDAYDRYYFASPSTIPSYNTRDRIVAGMPAWTLGVPAPGCSPGVSVTGGGNTLQLGALNANGTGIVNGLSNYTFLVPITPTGDTQIQDVQVVPQSSDPLCNLAAVIYLDNGGQPGELLNTGQVVTGITANTNVASTFVNPSGLLSNVQYWIGFITDSVETWQSATGSQMTTFANTFANGPAGEAPNVTATNQPNIQMFADMLTSDVLEARSYVYTYVTEYSEEGPPSPATLVNGWSNAVWTLSSVFTPAADDLGVNRNILYANLYRTVVGTGGGAVFYYIATLRFSDWAFSLNGLVGPWYSGLNSLGEPTVTINGTAIGGVTSTTETFTDTLPDNYIALNNQLPSVNYFPPPANLQGLTALPNGVMAGFKDNEVWFCQPYQPHAWPPGYVQTTEYPVVGLGVTSGALVAVTAANPYVFTGINPSAISGIKCPFAAPCLSRGSILNGEAAVTYMSQNGLIQVTNTAAVTNTTDLWFTREGWQQLTPQKYTRAIFLASCYFCFGTTSPSSVTPADNSVAQQGFTIELDQDNQSFSIWPQPGGHRLGFNPLTSHVLVNGVPENIDNVLSDPWTGQGMLIANASVYYYDFSNADYTMVPYTWTSKIYQQNNKKNYSAMRVFFTRPPNTPTQNACPNEACADDPSWDTLGANQLGIIKTFADVDCSGEMVLVDCREIRRSGELLRIVGGFKAEQWSFELLARVTISNVQIATSVKELGNV
jgi:hypothetical protein